MDRIVGGHYRLRRRIGAGSFGEIYSAENTRSHRRVAVKLESVKTRVPQLSYESKLYSIFSGGTGIPKLHWYGTEDSHNIMVIDLLGKSLEDLFVHCHHRLSLKTVLMLADQMISCVEFIHNKNFIHRDIKPDNFVMGVGNSATQVFIIDYGLAKKYRDQHTHMHIPYVEGKSLTGTARYASVGALRGVEQSRRDDLESLGFVWMYLLKGTLPWMGLNGRDQKQKYDRICDVKAKTSFEDLCRGFPNEFVRYFQIVRALRFTEKPNYAELRQMFRDLFIREGFVYDYKYDWCKEGPKSLQVPMSMPRRLEKEEKEESKEKEEATAQPGRKRKVTIGGESGGQPMGSTFVAIQSEPNLLMSTPRTDSTLVNRGKRDAVGGPQRRVPRASGPPAQSALAGARETREPREMEDRPRRRPRPAEETAKPAQRRVSRATEEPAFKAQSALASARRSKERKDDDTPVHLKGVRREGTSKFLPESRGVAPKRMRPATGNQDVIRRTLMPNWMQSKKPTGRRS